MSNLDIEKLLEKLEYESFFGDSKTLLIGLTDLKDKTEASGLIRWSNSKNIDKLQNIKQGTFILDVKCKDELIKKDACNYIFVKSPRYTFQKTLDILYPQKVTWKVSNNAFIHDTTRIDQKVSIGQNVVIQENCIIGKNVIIDANTVIKANTIIEENVTIGSNCTIGGVGFGYEKSPEGNYELLNHIGNVHIKRNAHIGNNTCIDRAVLGSTIIGINVKVDNLVHIAHGVIINDNALIIANAMVGGSVTIGKNVWVAPSSTIINKVTVGDDALVGLGAVVIKNIESNTVVVGNPAKPLNKKT